MRRSRMSYLSRTRWLTSYIALDNLLGRWREVLLLRAIDPWYDDEIAAAVNIDVEDVVLSNLLARVYLGSA
jgi:DNA-directed RNA polymerase specialized sigma24 family protein